MGKVIRDGMVAVLVSPGFGAGWFTWGNVNPFCPEIVHAIERGVSGDELAEIANEIYPNEYNGGASDLVIRWVPEGTCFRINEYDGSESLEIRESLDWMVA